MIGTRVGNYEIKEKLGEGGMGAVYMGEHPLIGKRVAIKVLLEELVAKEEVVSRFFNEAKAVKGKKTDYDNYIINEMLAVNYYQDITPPEELKPATIDTYDDHRMAMCFSLAALDGKARRGNAMRINDPKCVAKTFPDYFEAFAGIAKNELF